MRKGLLNGKSTIELKIPARRADGNLELARGDNPLLRANVPVANVPPADVEGGGVGRAGGELELLEAAELAGRGLGRGVRVADVQLGNLGAVNLAGVGDGGGHGGDGLEEILAATGLAGAGRGTGGGGRVYGNVGVFVGGVR